MSAHIESSSHHAAQSAHRYLSLWPRLLVVLALGLGLPLAALPALALPSIANAAGSMAVPLQQGGFDNLTIEKHALVDELEAGGSPGLFSIRVTNDSEGSIYDIPLVERPGDGLNLVSLQPGLGGEQIVCDETGCMIPELAGLSSAEIYALVQADADAASGNYVNTACTGFTGFDTTFDGSPGTGAPPATLGPYTMIPFPADNRGIFSQITAVPGPTGQIGFNYPVYHYRIGSGWATWSHGYSGDIYYTSGGTSLTISLPPDTGAFYFYAEPNSYDWFSFTATTQDGTTSGAVSVFGSSGATYFGFYSPVDSPLQTISITAGDNFAVGEFGIASSTGRCSDAPVAVTANADLSIAKTAAANVTAGEGLAYSLTVHNNGPADASGVIISDPLPAGLTFASADPACNFAGGLVTCALGSLSSSESMSVQINTTVDSNLAPGSSLANTAEVSATTADPDPSNNQRTAYTSVQSEADLSLQKSGPDTALAGEVINYNLIVHNDGPSTARGVILQDSLPPELTFTAIQAVDGDGNPILCAGPVCNLGDLPSGEEFTLVLTGRVGSNVLPETQLLNTATVSSSTPDDDPQNNTGQAVTTIQTQADLAVDKVDLSDPVEPGEGFIYQIYVTNHGPSDAQNVVVEDTLGAGLTFSTASPGCAGSPGSQTVTCTLDVLEAGETTFFLIAVRAGDLPSGTVLHNVVTVTSATTDPLTGDNTDTEETTIQQQLGPSADLAVIKTADQQQVLAGDQISYHLTVTNAGPLAATGVQLLEMIPADTALVSITVDNPDFGYEFCTSAGQCFLGTLLPNTTVVTVDVSLRVDPGCQATSLTNIASVFGNQADNNPDNNLDSAAVAVTPRVVADLAVNLNATPTVSAQGTIHYTVSVWNLGPQAANGVQITDILPADVTIVAYDPACSPSGNNVVCAIVSLASGGSALFALTVSANAGLQPGTTLRNRVMVGSPAYDPNPANNTDASDTSVVGWTELRLGMSGPFWIGMNDPAAYSFMVVNDGPEIALSVSFRYDLPPGMDLVSITFQRSGEAPIACGGIVCSIGDMAVGETVGIIVVAEPGPGMTTSQVTHHATVSSNTPEYVLVNNTATLPLWVFEHPIFMPIMIFNVARGTVLP